MNQLIESIYYNEQVTLNLIISYFNEIESY